MTVIMRNASIADRHAAKYTRGGPDDCWPWTAHLNRKGYGMIADGRRGSVPAHRVAYALAHGLDPLALPEGLTVDHECHNRDDTCPAGRCAHRACQNPAHLTGATPGENTLSGKGFSAENARLTRCVAGHELVEPNIYPPERYGGRRVCALCARERALGRHARLRGEQ